MKETALREMHEEVGVETLSVNILGELTQVYIPPSNYLIHPFVGYCDFAPNFKPNSREVKNIIEVNIKELYKKEVNMPFAVFGIIPNYVKEDKIALLVDAGMNRVRMGIQSGSENILEFYKRPTKLKKIHEATKIFNRFKH